MHFDSIKAVPARRRRETTKMHGRGKVRTPTLVVPFKEKRNFDGEVIRKKARITAADLVLNGRTASTVSANLTGETSSHLTQLELGLPGARTVHKDVGERTSMEGNPRLTWRGGARYSPTSCRGGPGSALATGSASTRSRGACP